MFKLPVCPHCHTVYHYSDVRKIKNKKEEVCYHCKKKFRVSKLGYIVLFLIAVLLTVGINVLVLSSMADLFSSTVPIIVISFIAVLTALIFIPFFIDFKKSKDDKK